MNFVARLLPLIAIALLSSCSWVHNLQLNTTRPAQIAYDFTPPSIVVVNNSVTPDVQEYSRYIDENGKRYRLLFSADSLPSLMTMSLATELYDSNFFGSVEALLPDSNLITGMAGVDSTQLQQWRAYAPWDVHVAIDNIKPCAIMRVEMLDGVFGVELQITSSAVLECYSPGQEAVHFFVSDTLWWYGYGQTPTLARMDLPNVDACVEEAIASLSVKAAQLFAPHNRVVERYIFVTGHPAMKDAMRYWQNEQYAEASYIWEYVYEKARDKGRRAKAAANLAIYYELEDEIEKARSYAQQSLSIFTEIMSENEAQYMSSYYQELSTRIEENNRLNSYSL